MKAATAFRRILAGALVVGLVWLAMVVYWRRSNLQPSAGDVGLYLVALPVALLGTYWLLRWGLDRRKAVAQDVTPGHAGASATDDGPQPDHVLHLLASAVLLTAGASAADVAAALVEPKRPGLHPQLKDERGLPVFAAAVEDIHPDDVSPALAATLGEGDTLESLFSDEQLRAVALLDPVAEELLYAALPAQIEADDPYATPRDPVAPASILRVRALLPGAWPQETRQAIVDWLLAKTDVVGYLPGHVSVDAIAVTGAADVWRLLDQLAQLQARAPDQDRHLLLAAHSLIGEESIDRLGVHRQLLGSNQPEGLIPGEGAAGLLLAGPIADVEPGAMTPLRLHRGLGAQALAGVPSRRVVQHASALMERALATAAQPAAGIGAVVSDADHRPSRAIEIAGAMSATFPELDPMARCLNLGVACGELGPVAALALLAVAAAQVGECGAPVLAMSLADPEWRVAMALSPLPAPPVSPEPAALAASA